MAFDPPLGSTSPAVLLDNATRLDKLANGPAAIVPDRAGQPLDSWRQMMAKNEALTEATRQNLIPLSRQYMTLAEAQADIANIPAGSTTYYRSPDDSALAIEVINNAGTLVATGRRMPSMESIQNLLPLNGSVEFRIPDDGEYEFGLAFDIIVIDEQDNILRYTAGIESFNFLNSYFSRLFVDGTEIDPAGIPTPDERSVLTNFQVSAVVADINEFEFNPADGFLIIDDENNIQFSTADYVQRSPEWDDAWRITQNLPEKITNPLLPWSEFDNQGKNQVRVFDTETQQVKAVTSGNSNETSPRPDGADRIVWQSDRSDPPPGGLFYAASPDFKEHAYIARKKIVGWGHSFINNGAFLNRMRVLTGLPTYNFGLSGQTSDAIAARQGGAPAYYAPVGGIIPESGAVALTPAVPGPCRSLAAPVALKCNLAGVDGTFTWNGTVATFTRLASGSAVTVSSPVALFVYPITTVNVFNSMPSGTQFDQHNECINLFWIGRNNISETSMIMSNAVSMANYVKNIGQKIVFLADFNASTEPPGSTGYSQMMALNSGLADKFPDFYCAINGVDIRQNFINHANPVSANDMADVAAGLTPRSLRYDNLHPSQTIATSLEPAYALDAGANVNANFVYQFLLSKGWL